MKKVLTLIFFNLICLYLYTQEFPYIIYITALLNLIFIIHLTVFKNFKAYFSKKS